MLRLLILLLLFSTNIFSQKNVYVTPDSLYGQLFVDVQMKRVFADSKTFVDCIPLFPPSEIVSKYQQMKDQPGFQLKQFVLKHFRLPAPPKKYISKSRDIKQHIHQLWNVLKRSADSVVNGSSLLPLPKPYIVPGGRFREVYYWDSYFTMLGLRQSKQYNLMQNMVDNFAYLLKTYGHIPNGNRTYYLSRSQPPFFSLMVELLASVKGKSVYSRYADALMIELNYWNNRGENDEAKRYLEGETAYGEFYALNRYYDDLSIPRQESYHEDVATAESAALEFRRRVKFADSNRLKHAVDSIKERVWHNLRSAAASGWDFSSRWFLQGEKLHNTNISDVLPVDLNCLTFHLQVSVKRSSSTHDPKELELFTANKRNDFRKLFFNEEIGWYCDITSDGNAINNPTLAGMYPLFFKLADKKDVPRIVAYLKKNFLKPGGVVTSLENTGQQWDAPNGWAPLQWITIIGLENYGYHALAKEIAKRWFNLNKKVFLRTGKLMEKYDVVDLSKPAGGGEYPSQDGFGWTNGVLLALMDRYKLK